MQEVCSKASTITVSAADFDITVVKPGECVAEGCQTTAHTAEGCRTKTHSRGLPDQNSHSRGLPVQNSNSRGLPDQNLHSDDKGGLGDGHRGALHQRQLAEAKLQHGLAVVQTGEVPVHLPVIFCNVETVVVDRLPAHTQHLQSMMHRQQQSMMHTQQSVMHTQVSDAHATVSDAHTTTMMHTDNNSQ